MKLKLDANGNVVLQDGKPVYVHDDGKEVAFDAPGTVQTIGRINGEARSHRERAEAAEGKLKLFEGIADPEEALKAIETMKNIDHKKLVDAGQIEVVKAEVGKAWEGKLAETNKAWEGKFSEAETRAKALEGQLYSETIGGSFARSKLVAEKLAIPPDMVQARFGSAFKIEEGKVVAYDQSGNKIFSGARPGEIADFDEALQILVDQYPYKNQILKGSGASGGGAHQNNNGGGNDGGKSIDRSGFDKLSAPERSAFISTGGKVTD
jgi:hypothetical protein